MLHTTPVLFDSYQVQGAYGSPAAGASRQFGTGTGEINKQGNNIYSRLPGNFNLAYIKGGGANTPWTYNFEFVHDVAPLKLVQRTNNQLEWFTIHSGWNEFSTPDLGWHLQDCHANTLALRLAAGDNATALTGTLTGFGRQTTPNTVIETPSDPLDFPFLVYESRFQLGGSACELESFELNVNNNLRPHWVIAGVTRTGTAIRFWDYLIPGNQDVKGTLVMLEPWAYDVHANVLPASQTGDLRFVNQNGGSIIQITLAGLVFDEEQQRNPIDGTAMTFSYPFTAKSVAFANV